VAEAPFQVSNPDDCPEAAFQKPQRAIKRGRVDLQEMASGGKRSTRIQVCERDTAPGRRIDPITCVACHKISVRPRYVICRHVIGLVLTRHGGYQGISRAECGMKLNF